jgi:hypothetical protein
LFLSFAGVDILSSQQKGGSCCSRTVRSAAGDPGGNVQSGYLCSQGWGPQGGAGRRGACLGVNHPPPYTCLIVRALPGVDGGGGLVSSRGPPNRTCLKLPHPTVQTIRLSLDVRNSVALVGGLRAEIESERSGGRVRLENHVNEIRN